MGLIGGIVKRVVGELESNPVLENGRNLIGDIGELLHAQAARIIRDPLGVAKEIIIDVPVAIFGKQPNPVQDAKDVAKDALQIVIDGGVNIFNAVSGDAVLLSPACASWGMFPNYEERGRIFKEIVKGFKE